MTIVRPSANDEGDDHDNHRRPPSPAAVIVADDIRLDDCRVASRRHRRPTDGRSNARAHSTAVFMRNERRQATRAGGGRHAR